MTLQLTLSLWHFLIINASASVYLVALPAYFHQEVHINGPTVRVHRNKLTHGCNLHKIYSLTAHKLIFVLLSEESQIKPINMLIPSFMAQNYVECLGH